MRHFKTAAIGVLLAATIAWSQEQPPADSGPTTAPSTSPATAPAMSEPQPAETPSSSSASPARGFDQYNAIVERNIFLRERPRPRPANTQRWERPRDPTPPETPEQRYVLRGVVIENDELRAYFENIRSNEGVRVKPGEAIGNGHIAGIAIDAVAYAAADGTVTWIDVGENLTGARDTRSGTGGGTSASATPSTSPSTTSPSTSSDPANLSVEERMRQRRLQQRGGGK